MTDEQARRAALARAIIPPDRRPVPWWRRRVVHLVAVAVAGPVLSLLCRDFGGAWCLASRAFRVVVSAVLGTH